MNICFYARITLNTAEQEFLLRKSRVFDDFFFHRIPFNKHLITTEYHLITTEYHLINIEQNLNTLFLVIPSYSKGVQSPLTRVSFFFRTGGEKRIGSKAVSCAPDKSRTKSRFGERVKEEKGPPPLPLDLELCPSQASGS